MRNSSSEVKAYMESEAFRKKRKTSEKIFKIGKRDIKISADERDRVLNKARQIIETGKGERLTIYEEDILKESAGVYFSAYKKAIEILDNKNLGGIDDEYEL